MRCIKGWCPRQKWRSQNIFDMQKNGRPNTSLNNVKKTVQSTHFQHEIVALQLFYTKVHVVVQVNTCEGCCFFWTRDRGLKAMDNRCFKTERTHCNILKATFSYQEEKGTFSRRLQLKRLCKYSISRRSALRSHKRGGQYSSAQKWLLNKAHRIHKHYPGSKFVTWPSIVYYSSVRKC